jgi:hypothetical protein
MSFGYWLRMLRMTDLKMRRGGIKSGHEARLSLRSDASVRAKQCDLVAAYAGQHPVNRGVQIGNGIGFG